MGYITVEDQQERFWKPNKKQEQFLQVPDTVREALYGGAAGGGKTEVLLALPIVKGWIRRSDFNGTIFRRTNPQLEESLIPKAKEFYKPLGAKFNETTNTFTFPGGGGRLKFDHLASMDEARGKDTTEYNYVGFEELTHYERDEYIFIVMSRLRGWLRVARAATNPGNIGHVWVRERFVDPFPAGGKLIRSLKSGLTRIFIKSLVTDNTWLMENDPDYVNALQELPEAEKRAKLYGDWYVFAGQVFEEFRAEHYSDEPDNALHVIPAFPIPSYWPKYSAIDWGYNPSYTWIGWAAISPDQRVFLYREYHEKLKNISDWASTFALMSQDENLSGLVIDPSALQKRGNASVYDQFKQYSGYVPKLAVNDRLAGKMLVHEYLRWKNNPPKYIPKEGFKQDTFNRIYRQHGEKLALSYRNLFEPQPLELNLPKLQIFNSCSAVVKALQIARYDEKKVDDVAEWGPTETSPGDDPYDGLRYLLQLIDKHLTEPNKEAEHVNIVNKAVAYLAATGDQTGFYRRMEYLEAKANRGNESIRRYHKSGGKRPYRLR